ncbi:hypothetical protein Tco_1118502, partial [Tanacetum coccineum]
MKAPLDSFSRALSNPVLGFVRWCGSGVGGEVMMLLWCWWGGGDMMMKVLADGDGSRGGGMIVGVRRQVVGVAPEIGEGKGA